jgi:succinoglycan biosynthesis protein ExoM
MTSHKPHICVCICTFKRPRLLELLLSRLEQQETEELFDYSIVIADNDQAESGRRIAESHGMISKVSLKYVVELRQNIALARNKAVANAKGDFIAFIDDDEFPLDLWLLTLYKAIVCFESDGILGPVIPYFEKEPPKWILKGEVFERPNHRTGHILEWGNTRTGNVLLKKNLFGEKDAWFDPVFGKGGEDQDFFARKIRKGHNFVWCREAPVFEVVPPERWKKRVLIRRALLRGTIAINTTHSMLFYILESVLAVTLYTIWLPVSILFGYHVFIEYLIKNCDHLGRIFTFLGINLVEEKPSDVIGGFGR